jgi:hypothetical protein
MATAKSKVLKLAAQHGMIVNFGPCGTAWEITVEAPDGFHFHDVIHEYIVSYNKGPWSYAPAWEDMLSRMDDALPLLPCDDECEWHTPSPS